MCKETCKICTYTPSENKSFYHAVPCRAIGDISQNQKVIETLQRNAQANTIGAWANSMYVSSNKDVALGYVIPLYKDNNLYPDNYFVIELGLKSELNYICCTDPRFATGDEENCQVSETDLQYITDVLGNNTNEKPFMSYLGEKKYAFECFHDSGRNTELIVPSQLVTNECFFVEKIEKWEVNKNGGKFRSDDR